MADAGLKLGVDGEKDFKRALSEINDTMKTLGTEMKLVSSEFDANDKSVTALKSRYGVMSQEVDAQSKKVDTLKDALEAASKEFKIDVEEAIGIFEGLEDNQTAIFSFDGAETAFHFGDPQVKSVLFEAVSGSSYTLSYHYDDSLGYVIYQISE